MSNIGSTASNPSWLKKRAQPNEGEENEGKTKNTSTLKKKNDGTDGGDRGSKAKNVSNLKKRTTNPENSDDGFFKLGLKKRVTNAESVDGTGVKKLSSIRRRSTGNEPAETPSMDNLKPKKNLSFIKKRSPPKDEATAADNTKPTKKRLSNIKKKSPAGEVQESQQGSDIMKPRKLSSLRKKSVANPTEAPADEANTAISHAKTLSNSKPMRSDSFLKNEDHIEEGTAIGINDALMEMAGKVLTMHPWYHGLMPREECDDLIKNDGDFLVRRTTVKKKSSYIVCVRHNGSPKHFPLNFDPKTGWELTHAHSAIQLDELLEKLVKSGAPIGTAGAVLKNPIKRPDYYILHENITLEKKLGSGAFGEVFSGKFKKQDGMEIQVAIKKIKAKSVQKRKIAEFMKEAKLMRRIKHRNCIMLYGVATQQEPLMIVLELATGGTLKHYLRKQNVAVEELVRLITDAARGMCYLSLRQVIHRDLAARNCLLGEMKELKISDFGLSVADCDELKLKKLKNVPIKWLAPESLTEGVFNTKTDVWSFGVLTWEICNRCKSDPFPGLSNAEAKNLILGTTQPLSAPAGAPSIAHEVIKFCFERNPNVRYDFVQILKLLAPDEQAPVNDV